MVGEKEFVRDIEEFVKNIRNEAKNITDESNTETKLVQPFFELLGYSPKKSEDVECQYKVSIRGNKHEAVDYALKKNDEPIILVEVKTVHTVLGDVCRKQLKAYFAGAIEYKNKGDKFFGILTDGLIYEFYTDVNRDNIMDNIPFFEINFKNELNNDDIELLKLFSKSMFDGNNLKNIAIERSKVNNINKIKLKLKQELDDSSDEFVKFMCNGLDIEISETKYTVKKAISSFLDDNNNNNNNNNNNRNNNNNENSNELKNEVACTSEEKLNNNSKQKKELIIVKEKDVDKDISYLIKNNYLKVGEMAYVKRNLPKPKEAGYITERGLLYKGKEYTRHSVAMYILKGKSLNPWDVIYVKREEKIYNP